MARKVEKKPISGELSRKIKKEMSLLVSDISHKADKAPLISISLSVIVSS